MFGVAGFQKLLGVEPPDHAAATAARRPQRIVGVEAELQVMRVKAGVDEGVFHRLRIEHGQLTMALGKREQLGRDQVRAFSAKVWILRRAHGGGEPQPAFLVEHGIMIVDVGIQIASLPQ